jgi:hypothetical protein
MPDQKPAHPLTGNVKWIFNQPNLGLRVPYVLVSPNGDREVASMQMANTCREGLISTIRQVLVQRATNVEEYVESKNKGWGRICARRVEHKVIKQVDLCDPAGKAQPTSLKIQWHPHYMRGWETFEPDKFLQVCDVVMGPVMVLLSPHRVAGADWWRSDGEKTIENLDGSRYIHWFGSDNWFLAHPVTVSIATGLYRQCFHLCGVPGLADTILATVPPEDVVEVMSTNNAPLALSLIKQTRPYIEVPAGSNGNRHNYPFALGLWRRLMRLQRAVRRTNYAEALGQDFVTGWNLISGQGEWKGVYSFWGDEGELTNYHRHLMKAGAPRRKSSGEKVANRTS